MKNGFTLIELLAVIVILAIILLIAMPIILNVINDAKKGAFESTSYGLIKTAENDYMMRSIAGDNTMATYSFLDGVQTVVPSEYSLLEFNGQGPQNGYIRVYENGEVELRITDQVWYIEKTRNAKEIVILAYDDQNLEPGAGVYQYFSSTKGVNQPQLLTGMTPIKWDGTEWVDTIITDDTWYDYNNQQWANAKSADGSYWVWIPRFAYQIETNYHANAAGNINVKFLKDLSNEAADSMVVDSEPLYDGNSQENFIVHPAFKFGTSEITGFWVAKFAASNSAHGIYNASERVVGSIPYTHLVEGKEYFWGYSSWLGHYYLGVVEPLAEDYNCNFYLNKRYTTSTDTYNRAYVICDVPYKYAVYSGSDLSGLGPVTGAPTWYYRNKEVIRPAGSLSTVVSHTSTIMYFSAVHVTADVYWTVFDTTTPTTDLAMNANISIYNDINEGYVKSIPNASAWRGMTVKNTFDKVEKMAADPVYGWNGESNIDVHLMKNVDWGAVAYLGHSSFGKNAEVWKNPSNQYITGCAGSSVSASSVAGCPNAYDTTNGMQASTTGNVYGVYDMNGGAYEVVMANLDGIVRVSGFSDISDVASQYLNSYVGYGDVGYGDAIYETSSASTSNNSWYNNQSVFMDIDSPWLWRGGAHDNSNSGIFSYNKQIGAESINNYTFRPVIIAN